MTGRFCANGNRLGIILLAISAGSILALTGRQVRASELFSESVFVPPLPAVYDGNPVTGWNAFNILGFNPVLPAQSYSDPNTNPFAVNGTPSPITTDAYTPLGTDAGTSVGPGLVTMGGLTRVHFTGTVPINQANIPNQNLDNPADQVQFGVAGPTDNAPLQILSQHWAGAYTLLGQHYNYLYAVPVVSIIPNPLPPATPPTGTGFDYIVDFVQFTQDGISGSEWAEFPYLAGAQAPTFSYGGWADPLDPIHFTYSAIQLSDSEIPLDELNFADDPLSGGTAGPAFTPQADPADVVPEPSAFMLAALGILGILAHRRK